MVGASVPINHGNLSLGRYGLLGLFSFEPPRRCHRAMPRYFFILAYPPDQEMSEPSGVMAPGDDAAITAARKAMDALLAELGPEDQARRLSLRTKRARLSINIPAIENRRCAAPPFPAALDDRGDERCLLHRPRQERAAAWLFLA
jgi:hypothetical protein